MKKPINLLLLFIFYLLFILALSRMLFIFLYLSLFPFSSNKDFVLICLWGIPFDLVSISMLMPLVSLWFFVPWHMLKQKVWQIVSGFFFAVYFVLIIGPSLIDLSYYSYNNKRLTFDVFGFIGTISTEFTQLIPRFIYDFWWILLLFLFLFLGGWLLYRRFFKSLINTNINYRKQFLLVLFFHGFVIVGARGSLGLRPLSILDASSFMGPKYSQAILNSTFTLIKTIGKKELVPMHFMPNEEAERLFPYCKQYHLPSTNVNRKNVVLIAVESLSSAYMGFFRQDGVTYTPFLDSLCKHALVLPYSFSNAKRSIEGIPAILSSYPALTNTPLLTSSYSSNCMPSIAHVLKKHGYTTAFFHGGKKGTMMFDKYAAATGFDMYFSEADYDGSPRDYDGHWGIYDEPFLQFVIRKINTFQFPFFSFIFTLSSHHPYTLPPDRTFLYSSEELPILPTIRYADFSLRKFFETAQKQPWFQHTLFIITADHSAQMPTGCFQEFPFNMAIPIIIYDPSNDKLPQVSPVIAQQIDIFPSIIDYLNFPDTICCFGNSFFSIFDKRFAVLYNFPDVVAIFPYGQFFRLQQNGKIVSSSFQNCMKFPWLDKPLEDSIAIKLMKAFYQQYVERTIKNQLCSSQTSTNE